MGFLFEAHLARFAYKGWNPEKGKTNKTKLRKRLFEIFGNDYRIKAIIENHKKGILCYIIKCNLERSNQTIIVFRGTNSLKNWIKINGKLSKVKVEGGGKIHKGFEDAVQVMLPEILKHISKAENLVLTGHSLGADLCFRTADLLHNLGYKIQHITPFEPAKFCDRKYRKITSKNYKRYIFKNNLSVVPLVPLTYCSYKKEIYYFDRHGKLWINPNKRITVLDKIMTLSFEKKTDFFRDHNMQNVLDLVRKNKI